MKRTQKHSDQAAAVIKPTTLNLQTRGFSTPQIGQEQEIRNQAKSITSENILLRLIANPQPAIQRKPQNSLVKKLPIQAKLNIGEPNDKYEQEADATATKVVQHINTSMPAKSVQRQESMEEKEELQMKSVLQRQENVGGGEALQDLESSIQSARGSGQSLDASLQTKMGEAMGADFSGVRVHTGSQSDQLNQSIQAKAFTTGQDVFFRQGEYNPTTQNGQELIAHELTHVMQQNGSAVRRKGINNSHSDLHIQRVSKNTNANQYYSDVLEGQKITRDNAVFTATSNIAPGGGHTSIYIESLDSRGKPKNQKIHLTYGGGDGSGSDAGQQSSSVADSSSGSSSSSGGKSATDEKGVNIEIINGYTAREAVKKSWVVSSASVEPAVEKARELQSQQRKYSYTLFGVSPFRKKVMNCAKFGEIVLKAAGINASSGSIFKIPSTLTKGKNKGYQNTLEQDIEENQKRRRILQQERLELEKQKYAKPGKQEDLGQQNNRNSGDVGNLVNNSEAMDWLSGAYKKAFDLASELPARKCDRTGRGNQLLTLEKNHKIMVCEYLENGEVLIDAGRPHNYCNVSLLLLFSAIVKEEY